MIVACTGHVEEEFIKKAWTHEIDEVISKPVNPQVLKDLLTNLTWMEMREWVRIADKTETVSEWTVNFNNSQLIFILTDI